MQVYHTDSVSSLPEKPSATAFLISVPFRHTAKFDSVAFCSTTVFGVASLHPTYEPLLSHLYFISSVSHEAVNGLDAYYGGTS
jgi:hypothetical protein